MITKSMSFFIPFIVLRINSKPKKKGKPTQVQLQLNKASKSTIKHDRPYLTEEIHKPWHVLISIRPVFLYFHLILICFSRSIVKYRTLKKKV